MAKATILPVFDIMQPEHEPTFQDFNRESDMESWRGRGSIAELPADGKWAGGNADADGDTDPIEKFTPKSKVVGPKGLLDKGNS